MIDDPSKQIMQRYRAAMSEFHTRNSLLATQWAKSVLDNRHDFLIVAIELTSIDSREILEVAAIDLDGNTQLDILFNPAHEVTGEAYHRRKLQKSKLERQPTWSEKITELSILESKILLLSGWEFAHRAFEATCWDWECDLLSLKGVDVGQIYNMSFDDWNSQKSCYNHYAMPGKYETSLEYCHAIKQAVEEMTDLSSRIPF